MTIASLQYLPRAGRAEIQSASLAVCQPKGLEERLDNMVQQRRSNRECQRSWSLGKTVFDNATPRKTRYSARRCRDRDNMI